MQKKYSESSLPNVDLSHRQGGSGSNLQVIVRCRPMLQKDLMSNETESVSVVSDNTLIMTETYDIDGHSVQVSEKARKLQFEFTKIFPKASTNQDIYNYTCKPMLKELFEGLNGTVFAYGASQSGKTFTMMGTVESPGIVALSVNDLVAMTEASSHSGTVLKMSFVEIYNEVLRDLLVDNDKPLEIREDPVKGIVLSGVSEITTTVKKDIMKMIK